MSLRVTSRRINSLPQAQTSSFAWCRSMFEFGSNAGYKFATENVSHPSAARASSTLRSVRAPLPGGTLCKMAKRLREVDIDYTLLSKQTTTNQVGGALWIPRHSQLSMRRCKLAPKKIGHHLLELSIDLRYPDAEDRPLAYRKAKVNLYCSGLPHELATT